MSKSLVLRTVLVVVSFWVVLLLTAIIWSVIDVPIAGMQPEGLRLTIMMTLPFTGGISLVAIVSAIVITWWRSQHHHEDSGTA